MNQQLIEDVLQWGEDKGITGPNGTGTKMGQVAKMMEEAVETQQAVIYNHGLRDEAQDLDAVKDGIGDTMVTLILLADLHGWTIEQCLQYAYNIISKRTGKMQNGTFVKDSEPEDDMDEKLGQACQLGDTECESCS